MKQRRVILILFLVQLFFFSCKQLKQKSLASKDSKKPNIIFLLTDDQRWDALSFAGNKDLKTPNIDFLAKNGVYFKNAYVTTSICAVSRASILSGQYARRHGIWGFNKNFTDDQLKNTYPLQLKEAGYTIGFIGKYGVGNEQPKNHFDYWKGFAGQGSFKAKDSLGQSIHLTKKIGQQAVDFLNIYKDGTAPFSLSISFKAPHVEGDPGYFLPDSSYTNINNTKTLDVPLTSKPSYFNHFPSEFTTNNVARNRWQTRFSSAEQQQESIKKYYQLIHGVDVVVGKIIKKLEEIGEDKNTVIIFTSDNGFYLGEYGFAGKWYGSEPSIRVPMIIYDPRSRENSKSVIDKKVLNIDLAPTILSYAGITPPKEMQGKDLTMLLQHKTIPWRDMFFYEHLWQSSKNYYIPSTEGVVWNDKKYMKYFKDRDTTNVIFEELYDLGEDPKETENLSGLSQKKELETILKKKFQTAKRKAY